MALSPATQAAINQAIADKQNADSVDQAHQVTINALNLAQQQEADAAAASLAAHQQALASAHAALAALAAELGVPLS